MTKRREEIEIESLEGPSERKKKGRIVTVQCMKCEFMVSPALPCMISSLGGEEKNQWVTRKERAGVIQKFCEEVNLLSHLCHPNVVYFLGVHFGHNKADISLIMEYMHMDLEHCITAYPNIPLPFTTSILRDVSYGLAYTCTLYVHHPLRPQCWEFLTLEWAMQAVGFDNVTCIYMPACLQFRQNSDKDVDMLSTQAELPHNLANSLQVSYSITNWCSAHLHMFVVLNDIIVWQIHVCMWNYTSC